MVEGGVFGGVDRMMMVADLQRGIEEMSSRPHEEGGGRGEDAVQGEIEVWVRVLEGMKGLVVAVGEPEGVGLGVEVGEGQTVMEPWEGMPTRVVVGMKLHGVTEVMPSGGVERMNGSKGEILYVVWLVNQYGVMGERISRGAGRMNGLEVGVVTM
jgi:hypothetical protein